MSATPTPAHFVTVKHTRDDEGDIVSTDVTFECRGDATSKCHVYPDCYCESWGAEHDKEHPAVAHDECWIQGWFDVGVDSTEYEGGDGSAEQESTLPERSGPIETSFDECLFWHWTEPVVDAKEA